MSATAADPLALLAVWIDVLESCLPTEEGYDDDTEQVLKNVIAAMRRELAAAPEHEDGHR